MDSFRNRKNKGPSILDELKEMKMLDEGEILEIGDVEYEDLIEKNAQSVVVRGLNRTAHKIGALIKALPPIWGIEDRVQGRGVGDDRVQFHFENDGDLYHVMHRGPWFVNGWIVALDKWKATPDPDYLKKILFWVRLKGIPVHLLKEQVIETIVENMGKVDTIELHAKNSNSVEYVRARMWINIEEPLQFLKTVAFKHGEVVKVEFTYEKLLKICYKCKRMTHDIQHCPFDSMASEERGSRRRGSGYLSKRAEAHGSRKGKGILDSERQEVLRAELRSEGSREGKNKKTTQNVVPKSALERLQWTSLGRKRSGYGSAAEWRIKETQLDGSNVSESSKSIEASDIPKSITKRRRLSGSEERASKKQRTSSSGEKSKSPSVFGRLGNSGEKSKSALGDSANKRSNEKERSSPSVFERLGSQASSSSPGIKSVSSEHSVHVTARLSNQSASSEAAHCTLSSGTLPVRKSSSNKKEGLMVNSNPSTNQ